MRVILLLALAMQILAWPTLAQARAGQVVISQPGRIVLADAHLFEDRGGPFPASAADVPAWSAGLVPTARVDPAGGAYWMVVKLRNDSQTKQWVISSTIR